MKCKYDHLLPPKTSKGEVMETFNGRLQFDCVYNGDQLDEKILNDLAQMFSCD